MFDLLTSRLAASKRFGSSYIETWLQACLFLGNISLGTDAQRCNIPTGIDSAKKKVAEKKYWSFKFIFPRSTTACQTRLLQYLPS